MSALYLKYRPQTIDDLDLVVVRDIIGKTLASKQIPHAWLFSGPKGTGKTSAARVIAKTINCEKKEKNPCNKCQMCVGINSGSALDIVEIDAASNRGIDEIRDLKEKIKLSPMKARYKVYIIDEAHMLTIEAANALLKTLEEPPEYTVFILCTTELDKLPATVVSRCTRVDFRKPILAEAVSSLEKVAKGENIKINKEALELLAKAAKGSFRDATKTLEQVMALVEAKEKIDVQDLELVLGKSGEVEFEQFLKSISKADNQATLGYLSHIDENGGNIKTFLEGLLEYLKTQLVAIATGENSGFSKTLIIYWINSLLDVYEQTRTSVIPVLPLQMWVVKQSSKKEVTQTLKMDNDEQTLELEEVESQRSEKSGENRVLELTEKWLEIMKAVRPKNHSVEALLRSTKPVYFDDHKVILEVFYKFHKDKLESEKCRQIVEQAVGKVMEVGHPVKLKLELGSKKKSDSNDEVEGLVEENIVEAASKIFGANTL